MQYTMGEVYIISYCRIQREIRRTSGALIMAFVILKQVFHFLACVTCITAYIYTSKISATIYHSELQGICSCDAISDSSTIPLPSIVWISR